MLLLLALVFTALFAFARVWYSRWPSLVWLFMIFLFATWGLGVWFRPFGPPVRGFYWLPFVAAIMTVALLLATAALSPRPPRKRSREKLKGVELRPLTPFEQQVAQERTEEEVTKSLGVVCWVLVTVAVIAVVLHYALPSL